MRQRLTALLALSAFLLLPLALKAQNKDSSDKSWPSLGGSEKTIYPDKPRFIIESRSLERAVLESNPPWIQRCPPASTGCVGWLRQIDFFSEWNGYMERSTLRPDVVMHHYPYAMFDWHFRGTGTYVFYLPERQIFYLWGDCAMGHVDVAQGPFAGDPRLVLKKLADDPDAVAQLGMLVVPFRGEDEAWPTVPNSGIDRTKLETARDVFNPLSLERCAATSEKCVMSMDDFSSRRKDRSGGKEKWMPRPNVIAHYYPGSADQYVFYLPKQNVFYIGGFRSSTPRYLEGPFAGDPRLVLKKLTNGANP